MGAFLIHPLTIALVGGFLAISIALYNSHKSKELLNHQFRIEAQVKAEDTIASKVNQVDCDSQVEKCASRFGKGEEQFRKIERALVAIYVKQGGTPQELDL